MAWQKELLLEKETALHKILSIRKKAALLRDSLSKNKQPVNKKMSLPQFQRKFATEKECAEHLFRLRWPGGFLCPRCTHPQYYIIKGRHLYQCANPECRYQASVSAGTVLHKIRKAMGARDARYLLCDLVEMDNVLLDIPLIRDNGGNKNDGYENSGYQNGRYQNGRYKNDKYQNGRYQSGKSQSGRDQSGRYENVGHEKVKVPVIVGVAMGITGYPRHIKMVAVKKNENFQTGKFIQRKVDEGAIIHRKLYNIYEKYAGNLPWYQKKYFAENEERRHLNRIRMAVSKAEAFLAETYHKLSEKHLQAYPDEFCYRYSRRGEWGQLFNRLLTACALTGPVTYAELMK